MKNIKVLTIDGGGIRGVAILPQLRKLEKELKGTVTNNFDYLGLNSTSGIIGVLLAIGYSVDQVEEFYFKHGENIFKKKAFRWGIFKSKYDVDYFEKILDEIIGDKKLSDLNINIVVSATNYSNRYDDKLVFLFKSERARLDPSADFYLKDVVRATTAAPIYFRGFKITSVDGKTKLLLGDGGLCINNPSHMTFIEASRNNPGCAFSVLSYSTGMKIPSLDKQLKDEDNFYTKGILDNIDDVIDIQMKANQIIADFNMKVAVEEKRCKAYLRLKTNISYSDGKIDNASYNNMVDLRRDGAASAESNNMLLKHFIETMNY